ncbi:MAG TPA: GNAT family N-acetyltransferase [Opitutaceae bacterium]|nr:GNAT family N-acetyltransferase [Opitutaceae bacterium]
MPTPSPAATLPPRTIVLRDSRPRRLRPLGAGDEAAVIAFFDQLSPATVRARYGYLIKDMTPDRAHRIVAADPAGRVALGVFEDGANGPELCAIGRLVHAPDRGAAECAFLVRDDRRRLRLASRLLLYLRVLARRRGVTRLFAQVRRDNRAMIEVFRGARARLHFSPYGDVVGVDIPLR